MTEKKINKSAVDGKFVSEKYLEKHPKETYKQTVKIPNKTIKKK